MDIYSFGISSTFQKLKEMTHYFSLKLENFKAQIQYFPFLKISPYKLIQHRRSLHTLEKPYVCEQCGEGFVRNDKLTVHKRRAHTGYLILNCKK